MPPVSPNNKTNNCGLNTFGLLMDEFSFEVQCLNTVEQTRTIVKVMA